MRRLPRRRPSPGRAGQPAPEAIQCTGPVRFRPPDHDRSMAPEAVARLGQALQDAGLEASNEIYAGAPHGYTRADTSSYDPEATERHFHQLQALTRHDTERLNSLRSPPAAGLPLRNTCGSADRQWQPRRPTTPNRIGDAGNGHCDHQSQGNFHPPFPKSCR
ncbi:dienelactone hydrolase family protein [bacterium RCC_150]